MSEILENIGLKRLEKLKETISSELLIISSVISNKRNTMVGFLSLNQILFWIIFNVLHKNRF